MVAVLLDKVTKMETSLEKVADAMTKLAVIEERQGADKAALERAFGAITKVDERCASASEQMSKRLAALELAAPMNNQTTKWATTMLWAAAAAAAMYVARKVGLVA